MDLQEVYRNIFLKNEKRHPFNKGLFLKHLGFGFTRLGVKINILWICKVEKHEEMAHYFVGHRKY